MLAGERRADLEGVSILLVEDEPRAAKWVRLALEERGARIQWATRLDQARLLVDRHRPELAVVDLSLPDGDGLDLVVELRLLEQPCACVIVTNNLEASVARIAAGLGVSEFLTKPVELERLVMAVHEAQARTAQLRRMLAEHKGYVVPSELEVGVARRLAVARDQPRMTSESSNERLAALAAEFGLSARQAQAMAGVAEGLSDADIAQAMKVSYSRTRQLLAAAFAKLGLKSRNDFIRFLWERSTAPR